MGRASRAKVPPPSPTLPLHPRTCQCRGCQTRRAASKLAQVVLIAIGAVIGSLLAVAARNFFMGN